jgi:large subunit ribosomal protein L4
MVTSTQTSTGVSRVLTIVGRVVDGIIDAETGDQAGQVDGSESSSVTLPPHIFDVETNVPLIHQVVVAQRAAARQGTHKVKRRGEVSGSGRKPFKQKGTGRARQGSIRAPQMTGGGVVHGPVPRDYSQRTPKKMIAAALLGALSDRARGERIHVVESLTVDGLPSTKTVVALLSSVAPSKNVLVVLERGDERAYRSVRNISRVHVLSADQLNAYDVLVSDDIIFTKAAFEAFVASKSVTTDSVAADTAVAGTSVTDTAAANTAAPDGVLSDSVVREEVAG